MSGSWVLKENKGGNKYSKMMRKLYDIYKIN